MLKKFTIKKSGLLTLLVAFCFCANSLDAQTVIFEEQFDGGIPASWTNNPISSTDPDSLQNTLWVWSANGSASEGAYAGAGSIINSPSVANGAALFNSDFLDNGGVQGAFGEGLSPSPHAAELISPIIDCSAFPDVSLQFYQAYRNFNSTTTVEISADGGATWEVFTFNDEIAGNDATANDDLKLLEISDLVGGSSQVQLKFVFNGDYYYWLIDDVRLIVSPNNNLEIPRAALSVLYGTPVSQRVAVEIDADVCNQFALAEQPNTSLNCVITDDAGVELFNQNVSRTGPFPVDSCEVMVIAELFDMESLALEVGAYNMTYTVTSDSANFTTNNVLSHDFTITSNIIRKTPFGVTGGLTVSGGGAYEFGYQFFIPNDGDQAMSANFAMAAEQGNNFVGEPVGIKLYKVGPTPIDLNETTKGDLEIIGAGDVELNASYGNYDTASVDLFSLDTGDQGVELEGGNFYCVVNSYSGENTVFTGVNSNIDYTFTNATHAVVIDEGDDLGSFAGSAMPIIDLFLAPIVSSTEEVVTSFNASLFPNPADQKIQLELNLETVAKYMNIKVTDAFGKVIENRNFRNVQNETVTFDTNQYAAGTYLIYLRSDNKVQSEKFMIVH